MALNDLELSLMAFPQRWDGKSGTLALNILLLPVGDPTAPLGSGPQFAGTNVALTVNFSAGLAALPSTATLPTTSIPYAAQPPAVANTLFNQLFTQLTAKGKTVTSAKVSTAPPATARILKSLPESYTTAFPFNEPRSRDLRVGDGYGCALRAQAPELNATLPPPDDKISWGQILSYALRQPVLARDMGLVYSLTVSLSEAQVKDGGYLWIALDTSSAANPWVSDFKANADTVKSYAARIPALAVADKRSLFAATLIPIVAVPPSNLRDAQIEAEEYDDGFAQIVHSNQPTTIDAATLDQTQIAPGTDAGIQIGWDDEQVTIWLNNQIDLLRDRVGGTTHTAEVPLGVQGYRIDVRKAGEATWRSLSLVNGTLPFSPTKYGGGATTGISGNEFWVAPAPIRPSTNDNTTNDQPDWLPLYFAQWAGSSLVLPDPVVQLLAYAVNAANTAAAGALPTPTLANPNPDLTDVPTLLYGNQYEFRVRLVDLTGGGPHVSESAVHPGPAPVAETRFLRHVPPKSLEIVADPPTTSFPAPAPPAARVIPKAPAVRKLTSLTVRKPRIQYPEAVFAGVDPSTFDLTNLGKLIQAAWGSGSPIGVPDPDVTSFEVRVEARIPAHDTGTPGFEDGDLDGLFRVIYSVQVPFPAGADPAVTITLDYQDGIDDIATMATPPAGATDLPIPTSRDIRVRLYPLAEARPNYYGSDAATIGLSRDYIVRSEAQAEDTLFPNNPELQLQAFYFQPGANIAQALAQRLGLVQQGFAFSGAAGQRTVFGGSGYLRHTVSADDSTLTISNQTELLGQWIVCLTLDVERDWTWDGFGAPALSFARDGANIGSIAFPRVVRTGAIGLPGQTPNRSLTRIVFFDAVNPHVAPPSFPRELALSYTVTAQFTQAPTQTFVYPITLPITTNPSQTPKIVSTGIAESPYEHSPTYSTTSLRDRYLWIEFDQPIQDSGDNYFARVLGYGPDPLLAGSLLPKFSPANMLPNAIEPPLAIDPELIREISSGQSSDESGLEAMTQMVPADKVGVGKAGTFFLLPLPPGVTSEDLELFGFWTYEFRVGHAKYWSTAQARYGRPLRVTGLQHPAPHLICTVERSTKGVNASAPYAVTVYNGNRLYDLKQGDPQTRMWFLLYAQVLQADGASYRNILVDRAEGTTFRRDHDVARNPQHGHGLGPVAIAKFPELLVEERLLLLGLPLVTALSVIAVEVLPGPLHLPVTDRAKAEAATTQTEDPLGAQLGVRRIMRTSPLTAVPSIC